MIVNPPVEDYLYGLLPPSPPVLAEMESQAKQRSLPIIGPMVARCLALLTRLVGAKRVFELGSNIGYSTLWWASAVGEGGEVFYTDLSSDLAAEARGYFERAGLADRIRTCVGDALQSLASTPGELDIIFIDHDKPQYPAALRQALPRLRTGGLLVADNVLWRGQVAEPATDEETRAIIEFNRLLYADPRLEPVILPLRDGVAVARKRAA
ncbi:MAG: O-methyltransferase [Acidobacteria bacterium]|nr:MAG: O-methyltransferase [Acidobacteriota bacterium]